MSHPAAIEVDLSLVRGMCAAAARARPVGIERLSGGRNNRVYRVDLEDGTSLALKCYFRHPADPRDRLAAEWDFVTLAWERGVNAVPEPIFPDREGGHALYGFATGQKLSSAQIGPEQVRVAADFVCAVNAGRPRHGNLGPGSEACFSLSDHLRCIDDRLARLRVLDPRAPHVDSARALVEHGLRPGWTELRASIEDAARSLGTGIETPIGDSEIIVSPSDFGFHNILSDAEGRLTFLDFEYAGRDDPAKLAGDFFSCPEVPTPEAHFDLFADALTDGLSLDGRTRRRMECLLPAYRVKWACIVLNDFLERDNARRHFAQGSDRAARCAGQIEKAIRLAEKAGINLPPI